MSTNISFENSSAEDFSARMNPDAPIQSARPGTYRADSSPNVVSPAALPANHAAHHAANDEADDDFEEGISWGFLLMNAAPSWMFSTFVHVIVLLILALSNLSERPKTQLQLVGFPNAGEASELEQFELHDASPVIDQSESASFDFAHSLSDSAVPADVTQVSVSNDVEVARVSIDLMEFGNRTAPKGDLMKQVGGMVGRGIEGRGGEMRGQLLRANGGTPGSEAAVALALKWFADHQMADGGWSFDHRGGSCQGRCSRPGKLAECRTGATALALLPFLGSGQTHVEGEYKRNVQAGLEFLVASMKPNGDLSQAGGSLYAHGLSAICLCEAYAMTYDKRLMAPAQASLNFIVFAQDPIGGGWRYQPKQPGDTSVVGWQLMALKSGHMAHLMVPPATIAGASKFLDSVQTNGGANYGYNSPGSGDGQTAVGLLCRMYLGWKRNHAGIERGTDFLIKRGPKEDMYYNYYATQVLRHFGGQKWETWNAKMRDTLVNSQMKKGHEAGSWAFDGNIHGYEHGGRLYCTSLATMILEVYYRHLPIYKDQAADEEFPLL